MLQGEQERWTIDDPYRRDREMAGFDNGSASRQDDYGRDSHGNRGMTKI